MIPPVSLVLSRLLFSAISLMVSTRSMATTTFSLAVVFSLAHLCFAFPSSVSVSVPVWATHMKVYSHSHLHLTTHKNRAYFSELSDEESEEEDDVSSLSSESVNRSGQMLVNLTPHVQKEVHEMELTRL